MTKNDFCLLWPSFLFVFAKLGVDAEKKRSSDPNFSRKKIEYFEEHNTNFLCFVRQPLSLAASKMMRGIGSMRASLSRPPLPTPLLTPRPLSSSLLSSPLPKKEKKGYLLPVPHSRTLRHQSTHNSPPPNRNLPIPHHKHFHTSLPTPSTSSPPTPSSPKPPKKPTLYESLFGSEEGGDKVDNRVWPIAMSSLLMGTAIGVVIPVMPLFAREMGLSPSDFGLVVSVMGLTRLLVNMPMAALGDTLGRKPLLVCGPIGTSLSMIGTGLSRSLFELLSWRFATGVSGAAQMTGSQLYLADISHPGNRARTMSPMMMAWSTGVLIGPALGGVVAEQYGLRAPFTLVGLAAASVALNNMRLPETHPGLLSEQAGNGKEGPLGTAPSIPRPSSASCYFNLLTGSYRKAFGQWRDLLKDRDIFAGVSMQAMYWFCLSGAQFTILPLLGTEKFGLPVSAVGGMFALMAGINIVGSQPAAYLSDKYGRKLVIGSGALTVASALAFLPFATETWELVGLLGVWGTGACLWGSAPTTYISDLTNPGNRSQALAMLRSAGDFGLMCGALVSGCVVDMIGMEVALGMNSSVLLGSAALFSMFARESLGRYRGGR